MEIKKAQIQAVGWTWAKACTMLDRGEDPRSYEMGKLVDEAQKALELSPEEESDTVSLQRKIVDYVNTWEAKGQYMIPSLADCLDFMMTEVSEAIEKRLRTKSYIRNNPEPIPSKEEIAIEVFDAIAMGCIALDILGFDLEEVADKKLRYMDDKRRSE